MFIAQQQFVIDNANGLSFPHRRVSHPALLYSILGGGRKLRAKQQP